jgi:hypothetical protein
MTKRDKSSVLIANNLGRHALVFNEDDVVLMLRAAVEHEGSQVAFAKRHGLDRVLVNMILNGKKAVSGSIAKALGLGKVYVAEQVESDFTDHSECSELRCRLTTEWQPMPSS